jgi:hypothetical protein
MNKRQNLGYHRYKSVKNSLTSVFVSEIQNKPVLNVPMDMKHGLPPKAKIKRRGFANKLPSGRFESNGREFNKYVRRIKQIGLKFVLFARRTYAALERLIRMKRQEGHLIFRGMKKQNV